MTIIRRTVVLIAQRPEPPVWVPPPVSPWPKILATAIAVYGGAYVCVRLDNAIPQPAYIPALGGLSAGVGIFLLLRTYFFQDILRFVTKTWWIAALAYVGWLFLTAEVRPTAPAEPQQQLQPDPTQHGPVRRT